MNDAIIKLEGLTKRFLTVCALDNIDLEIEKGSIVGLLGPNGSGKSTMLKIIAGLSRPDTGTVRVFDQPVGRKTKKRVAFLPEINHCYKWMTVDESLKFFSNFYANWDYELEEEMIDYMNLRRDAKVKNLSKGMKARLKLIITLAQKADLVLLDEPFSGIDPQSRGRIMDALTSQYIFGEQTLIVSTHEVMEAERIFDTVILLDDGKIKEFANADELRASYGTSINDLLKEVFV
mgnify:CR=1 FL=1